MPGRRVRRLGARRGRGADACVLVTEWPEFAELDWAAVARARWPARWSSTGATSLDREAVRAAGLSYEGIGRLSVQALILAGGEGTRLRPLTSSVPKPVVPLAGRPFISYMIEWLRRHGVDDVILSCGFMADGVRGVLGDGSALGRAAALRRGARAARHRRRAEVRRGPARRALPDAQRRHADRHRPDRAAAPARADGRARDARADRRSRTRRPTGSCAGARICRCRVPGEAERRRDRHQPGQRGRLRARALGARRAWPPPAPGSRSSATCSRDSSTTACSATRHRGYWMDIGTPRRYLQATYDILEGEIMTEIGGARLGAAVRAACCATAARDATAGLGARAGGDRRRLHDRSRARRRRADRARRRRHARARGARRQLGAARRRPDRRPSRISRSIVGPGAQVGDHCRIDGEAVLGAGVRLGSHNALTAGIRIFPGVELPDSAVAF